MKQLFFSFSLVAVSIVTRGQSLPRWVGVSNEDTTVAAINATVDQFVRGISTHNVDLLRASELPEGGGVTIVIENADGTRKVARLDWEKANAKVAAMPPNYDDHVYDRQVTVDGDMAFVWARFTVSIDGTAKTGGTEHYSLVRKDGAWKIVENAWTQHLIK